MINIDFLIKLNDLFMTPEWLPIYSFDIWHLIFAYRFRLVLRFKFEPFECKSHSVSIGPITHQCDTSYDPSSFLLLLLLLRIALQTKCYEKELLKSTSYFIVSCNLLLMVWTNKLNANVEFYYPMLCVRKNFLMD